MLILHGIYDNGKVEVIDKKFPHIKKEVKIILTEDITQTSQKNNGLYQFFSRFNYDLKNFKFNREKANER